MTINWNIFNRNTRHNAPMPGEPQTVSPNVVPTSDLPSSEYSRQRVFDQLRIDEGVVYRIYLDHLGNPTFGVGHLVVESDPEWGQPVGTRVSDARVWEAFEQDLTLHENECLRLYGPQFKTWPGEVQEILVNMMFNMGRNRMATFVRFRSALESRNWRQAAAEGRDSLWYRQVPNRAERLMLRLEQVRG